MGVYIFAFSYLFLCSIFQMYGFRLSKKSKLVVYSLIGIILICISGFRYGLETDYWHYYNIFNGITTVENIEPTFEVFINIFKFVLNDYNLFLLFVAIVSLGSKIKIFYRFKYCFVVLFVYYLRFYVLFELNAVRQGIALTFALQALFYLMREDKKKYATFTIIAILFHNSAAILLIIPLVRKLVLPLKTIIISIAVSLLFRYYVLTSIITLSGKFIPQVLQSNINLFRGIQWIINANDKISIDQTTEIIRVVVMLVAFYFLNKHRTGDKNYNFMFNVFFVGCLLNLCFVGFDTISYRLAAYFLVVEGMMLSLSLSDIQLAYKTRINIVSLICVAVILAFDIYTFFNYMGTSETMIPYQSFLFK